MNVYDKSSLLEFLESGYIEQQQEEDIISNAIPILNPFNDEINNQNDDSNEDEYNETNSSSDNMLNPLSEEQKNAIMHIINGNNLILDSVSGSGKSTCVLNLAYMVAHESKKILQLTYNSDLRLDVKKKITAIGLKNITVHTFHSLAVKYYNRTSITDNGIRQILSSSTPSLPIENIPKFDILVLDESQDMSFLYYQFMVKFSKDMNHPFQIFILGDYKQCLYQFKGADSRYLTLAQYIWDKHPLLKSKSFHYCKLKTSYRITHQIASFLNEAMLGENRMIAVKDGPPVIYIRNSRHNAEKMIINYIKTLLQQKEYTPNDIFILAPSVKTAGSNIRKMENYLVEHGIPTYVPMFETEKLDKRVMEGKVVFSTFHSVKGRERKIAIVCGFDQSYFDFYGTNLNSKECPNTLYVATTRPQMQLIVIENNQNATDRPLEFLKLTHYEMKKKSYIDFKGMPQSIFYMKSPDIALSELTPKEEIHDVTPTNLIQFIPESTIDKITPLLNKIFICETGEIDPKQEIPIPAMIQTKSGLYEDVSDLNGIAIPSIYYDYIYNVFSHNNANENGEKKSRVINTTNVLYNIIDSCLEDTKPYEYIFLKKIVHQLPKYCYTPKDYLYLANVFIAVKEKLYFKLKQIEPDDYNWLNQSIINWCIERLNNIIGKECKNSNIAPLIEYPLIQFSMVEENARINEILRPFFPENMKFRFSARTDLITYKTIWEIKCTSTVSMEHKLQTLIYSWLWRCLYDHKENGLRETKILNIKTGELWRLDATFDELTEIMVELLKGKYNEEIIKSDDEFISDCVNYLLNS